MLIKNVLINVLDKFSEILLKLKESIIHKLGGYTQAEYDAIYSKGYDYGIRYNKTILKALANKINGCDKQTWIDTIYDVICH